MYPKKVIVTSKRERELYNFEEDKPYDTMETGREQDDDCLIVYLMNPHYKPEGHEPKWVALTEDEYQVVEF